MKPNLVSDLTNKQIANLIFRVELTKELDDLLNKIRVDKK